MLPVVAGVRETARQILLYSVLMVAISLILYPVTPMGPLYLGAAGVLGAVFLVEAWRLWQRVEAGLDAKPMRLFHWSITYLTLLFAAMAIDRLVS
jgi:protoheme IX farnesyltransferase